MNAEVPMQLHNGAEVHAYTEQHPGGNGHWQHGIALCCFRGEWVTWTIYCSPDGRWMAETGHYFQTDILAAVDDYRERAGLNAKADV